MTEFQDKVAAVDDSQISPKLAIIMRGLPGSGKSSWVEAYMASLDAQRAMDVRSRGLFSTDSFFLKDGKYLFDISRLAEYHQRNLTAFIQALSRGEPIVICDNTNMAKWEFMAYDAAARALGYQVRLVLIGDPSDGGHQAQCAARNDHGVSLEQIRRMAAQFEPF